MHLISPFVRLFSRIRTDSDRNTSQRVHLVYATQIILLPLNADPNEFAHDQVNAPSRPPFTPDQ